MELNNWFIKSCTNNNILCLLRELLYTYWAENDRAKDYFLTQLFLTMAVEYYKEEYNRMPIVSQVDSHILATYIAEPYDEDKYALLKQTTGFHKLSTRFEAEKKEENKIPKIIHYCWFGGKPIPKDLQDCIDTWSILKGYQVMRWDESNCSFDENEFVRKTYAEKQLGFIGDYYRLKAVYEYGGIYLDTDVKVCKSFDPLLDYPAFLNFIFDCSVGSAIIGARKVVQSCHRLPGSSFERKLKQKDISFRMATTMACLTAYIKERTGR